ncbi:hypothetical protein [Vibrio rarus]|uniref:hypothetical protein n=1 Tax=Vibrio rarus TaxID=413403 RepID=UPI0021C3B1D3|nr:hypothetical protein [Vibrio rarus]
MFTQKVTAITVGYVGMFLLLTPLLFGCQSVSESAPITVDEPTDPIQTVLFEQVLSPAGLTKRSYGFLYAYADLNGDTEDELLILMQDPYFCGSGGCSAFLFDSSQQLMSSMSVVKRPILLSHTDTNGWKNIAVWSDGTLRLLKFDGQNYPANASTQPRFNRNKARSVAHDIVVNSDLYQDGGYELIESDDLAMFTLIDQFQFQFKRESAAQHLFIATVNALNGDIFFSQQPIIED